MGYKMPSHCEDSSFEGQRAALCATRDRWGLPISSSVHVKQGWEPTGTNPDWGADPSRGLKPGKGGSNPD